MPVEAVSEGNQLFSFSVPAAALRVGSLLVTVTLWVSLTGFVQLSSCT